MGLPCCHGSRPALRWRGSAGSRSGACPKEAPNDQGLVRDDAQAAVSIRFVAVGHGTAREAAFARLRPPVGRTLDDVFELLLGPAGEDGEQAPPHGRVDRLHNGAELDVEADHEVGHGRDRMGEASRSNFHTRRTEKAPASAGRRVPDAPASAMTSTTSSPWLSAKARPARSWFSKLWPCSACSSVETRLSPSAFWAMVACASDLAWLLALRRATRREPSGVAISLKALLDQGVRPYNQARFRNLWRFRKSEPIASGHARCFRARRRHGWARLTSGVYRSRRAGDLAHVTADEQERAVAQTVQRVAGQGLDVLVKLRREQRRLLGLGGAGLALDALPDVAEAARGGQVEMRSCGLVSRPDRGEPTGERRRLQRAGLRREIGHDGAGHGRHSRETLPLASRRYRPGGCWRFGPAMPVPLGSNNQGVLSPGKDPHVRGAR